MAREIVEDARAMKVEGLPVTLQLERVYCGKNCRSCPHGPYWYAYWHEIDPRTGTFTRTVTCYIGRDVDKAAAKCRAARTARAAAKLKKKGKKS